MSSKIRNVALLLPAFVLATGLASAQQGVTVSTVNPDGTVTQSKLNSSGTTAKAPTAAPDGSAKYWDGLYIGGASTNYFTQVPYITQPPNPQIATGPDDILTIVNRTISRYPNPNAAGNTGTLNPYNYPPTELVPLDVWMGLTVLGGNTSATALCPSGTGSNSSCVIDNASIRYDQLQGRFIVLFTVTDLPAHRSNWVLVVSSFAQFQKCPVPAPSGSVCPASSPLFTAPVIAPIVGGNQTGGVNTANWVLYTIPINLLYNQFQQPNALGLVANSGAPSPFNNPLANSAVGTPTTITTGGTTTTFLTVPFCANGGPNLPLTYGGSGKQAGGTGRTCTNYLPTQARFGIDNDNIILTAPVLDLAYSPNEGNFPSGAGQVFGPYAGTRVTTIAKLQVYNGLALNLTQPGPGGCTAATPVSCMAVNLADNTATGTLTAITQKVAYGFGAINAGASANGDVQYGGGTPTIPNSCITAVPVALTAQQVNPVPAAGQTNPAQTPANIVLSCAPVNDSPTIGSSTVAGSPANETQGLSSGLPGVGSPGDLPAIFWEPDNLRGRSLASFDAQVAPFGSPVSGVITPYDYLVGTEITDNFGQGIVRSAVAGIQGQNMTQITVTASSATAVAPFTFLVCTGPAAPVAACTTNEQAALAALPNSGVGLIASGGQAVIISVVGNLVTVTAPVTNGSVKFVSTNLGTTAATPGIATKYYVQSIVFSCPGQSGLISDFTNCFQGAPGAQSVVADLPVFGPLFTNTSTLSQVADPSPVGQGFGPGITVSAAGVATGTQLTTSPSNTPVTSTAQSRIFVGDSRPEQVIFREGLLYVARSVRLADQQINWLGTSTVLYDILKTCATISANPSASNCGAYDVAGKNISSPALAFEYEWYNGLNVPDPNGDILGFGFYQPMFDVPADVVQTGPISPISTLQLFDKLFVGMTTGGTANTLGTFSKDYPSLWDFRPGDDAYDTQEPYLDPYAGIVDGAYNGVCGGSVTQPATTVSVTATQISAGSANITVASTTGLALQQSIQTGFPTVTVVSPATGTSTSASKTPVGSASTTAFTCIAVAPGCPAAAVSTTTFGIKSTTNVGVSEYVTGVRGSAVTTINTFNAGSTTILVPNTAQVAIGEIVSGTGICSAVTVNNITSGSATTCVAPFFTTITGLAVDPFGNIIVTLSQPASGTGTSVVFDDTPCFGAFTSSTPGANVQRVTSVQNASQFVVGGATLPGVTYNGTLGCSSFYADPNNGTNTGQAGPLNQLNGIPIDNGIPALFVATGIVKGNILNINAATNVVTLDTATGNPLPGGAATTANIPINFNNGTASAATVVCPLIPFSQRGGAATDPNDGSLWLYGEFAKNRLSTIPGPGQWGTSVANYALSFPAVDPYGNDNTYFQDVQPTGSPDSTFFTWIQLAKNLGLAVPSATGPCTINNGNTPILQPPVSGSTPNPSPSTLGCPYFGPDTVVTRAEMAYWVVKAQMDEAQVSNYLCATGGDPTGTAASCNGSMPSSSFADTNNILNPFLGANPALNIAGVTNAQLIRYIEVMARRGYTKGCSNTNDPQAAYCPNQPVTRAQMSVFLIRAKMNNVFPTQLSGFAVPTAAPYGDNFGTFLPPVPYFSDVTASDPVYGPYYIYIQKMRELRITNGTGGVTFSPGNNLTRKEIATFVVRAFFL